MSDNLVEAIKEGMKKAGWTQPTEDLVRQIAYAVNQMEGRAANEAEKAARRKVAVGQILDWLDNYDSITVGKLDDLFKEAQG